MRNRLTNKSIVIAMGVVFLLSITVMMSLSQAPAAAGGQGGGGRGGRGAGGGAGAGAGAGAPAAGAPAAGGAAAPAAPGQAPAGGGGRGGGRGGAGGGAAAPEPTPRFADGTVNLGRSPGESTGIWSLPYITNMGAANVVVGAQPAPAAGAGAGGGGGRGGGGGGRGGGAAAGGAPAAGGGGRGGGGNTVPALRGSAAQPWVPFLPWAAAFYDYNQANAMKYDPEGQCMPPGGPRMFATPYPMEIIQSPETKRIWMVFEGGTHVWREIHMDGRAHPKNDTIKGLTWLGDSVGHWEGDTLVVDVVNFQEGTWLDYAGHPHTDQLHVVEKFTRPNKGTLHYEALIDDPGAYTRPWSVQWNINWNAGGELKEYICQENNLYLNHLKDDLGNSFIPH